MRTVLTIVGGVAAAGAAAAYLSRNRTSVKRAKNTMKGAVHSATPHFGSDDADDGTLADRVKSEIFRAHEAPKGGVSVDVQAGVAYLRGEVPSDEWIERFGKDARKVRGISGVKNLLHTPGAPTPAAEPRFLASEQFRS
jgi:osmotically-inducible protein OsmY